MTGEHRSATPIEGVETRKNIMTLEELIVFVKNQFMQGLLVGGDKRPYNKQDVDKMIAGIRREYQSLSQENTEAIQFILNIPESNRHNPLNVATRSGDIRSAFRKLLENLREEKKASEIK